MNAEANWNMQLIFVTLSTLQPPSGWLNDEASQNIQLISVHPTSLIIKDFALKMKTYAVLGQTEFSCSICGNSWKVLANVILQYLVPIVPCLLKNFYTY